MIRQKVGETLSELDRESNVVKEGMRDLKNKVEEEKKKQIRKWIVTFVIQHFITIAIVFGVAISILIIVAGIGEILGLFGGNGNGAYAEDEFTSVENSTELLKEYIHSWEGTPPKNADGTMYIIHNDGYGHPTVGWGVDIHNGGFTKIFEEAGYPTSIGGEVDIDFVDALEMQEIENAQNYIVGKTEGLGLQVYQIHSLVSRAYNCGNAGAIDTKRGNSNLNFIDAYNKYWNKDTDNLFGKESADFENSLYKQYLYYPVTSNGKYSRGLENRRRSEFTLFQTGYYDRIDKWYSESTGNATTIIEWAEEIHSYMENNNYLYCVYGSNRNEEHKGGQSCGLNKTFEQSKTGHKTSCCATFVSWVLQEAGYISDSEHNDSANNLRELLVNKGWNKITNSSELQPGDVLCFNGHIEIYAGDGKSYNAGSGRSIRAAAPAFGSKIGGTRYLYGLRAPH